MSSLAPNVLRFEQPQPEPLSFRVARDEGPSGRVVTAITRTWADGDTSRCRLCPAGFCNAYDDNVCLVQVLVPVPSENVALFSTHGLRMKGGSL